MMRFFFAVPAIVVLVAAAPAVAVTSFTWAQGAPSVDMGPLDTQFCFLQAVQGKFSGDGERVNVIPSNGRWRLGGRSQQQGVAGAAICAPRTEFGKANDTRMASGTFGVVFPGSDGTCTTRTRKAWWGDAWTAVSAISGRLRGGGEYVQIDQSAEGKGPSVLRVQTCQEKPQMAGAAISYFAGTPSSGKLARFFGPKSMTTPAAAAFSGEYGAGSNQTVTMASTNQSYCYLSAIGGSFQGAAERVEIVPGVDGFNKAVWVLKTRSQSAGGIFARARCLAKKG